MSTAVFNPFIQALDLASVLAAHERAGSHASVACRVVRPLDYRGDARPHGSALVGFDAEMEGPQELEGEDVDDGMFVD